MLYCRRKSIVRTRIFQRQYNVVIDHIVEKTPITAQLWQLRRVEREKCTPMSFIGSDKKVDYEILSKSSGKSRLTLQYKFDVDAALRDLYVDNNGNVSIGKILEDLDAMAGNIAHTHCDDHNPQTPPLSLVTASADNIRLKEPINIQDRLTLSGQVVWVGSSSLDIAVEVHRNLPDSCSVPMLVKDAPSRMLSSIFTYVARDKLSGKAQKVNRLLLNGDAESNMFSIRETIVNERKAKIVASNTLQLPSLIAQQSINVNGLDAFSSNTIELLVARGQALQDMYSLHASNGAVLISSTCLQNAFVCQPQKVNTSGKVFGGYLMHKAYDLAAATGYLFAGAMPIFKEVDKIHFRKPVEVGNLISMHSKVVYSSGTMTNNDLKNIETPIIMVEVMCNIVNPEKGTSVVSTLFILNLTFLRQHL